MINRITYYLNIVAALLLVLHVFPSLLIRTLSSYDKETGQATILDRGATAVYATAKGGLDLIAVVLLCLLLALLLLNAYVLRRNCKCQQGTGADRGKPS